MESNYRGQWNHRWRETAEANPQATPEEKAKIYDREMGIAMKSWAYALADLTPEELRTGVTESMKRHKHPPNIAEFIEASGHQRKTKIAAHRRNDKALLPPPKQDKTTTRIQIGRLLRAAKWVRGYRSTWQQIHGMRITV